MAGIEAVRGDQSEPEKMRQEFHRRRDVFVDGLNQIKGFSCKLPKGAFYTFPNTKQTGWPSKKLADALLDDVGVAALSGTAFGAYGEGYLRFSERWVASSSGPRRICSGSWAVGICHLLCIRVRLLKAAERVGFSNALKGRSFSCAVDVKQ
jgi:hypothetical protein